MSPRGEMKEAQRRVRQAVFLLGEIHAIEILETERASGRRKEVRVKYGPVVSGLDKLGRWCCNRGVDKRKNWQE